MPPIEDEVLDDVEDNEIEDRGDVVTPDVSVEALKELAKEQPEEPKPEGKPDEKPEDDERHSPNMIPKARFNEVNEAKKQAMRDLEEAQAEIERLRAQSQPPKDQPKVFDEVAQERAYVEALMEGDTDKATQIRHEINANLREQAALEIEARMTQRQAATALQEVSTQAVKDWPYLDTPDGALAIKTIIALRDADIAKGVQAHIALRDAVSQIAPRFAPASDEKTAPPAEKLADTRTADAIKRGAKESQQQPPSVQAGIGNRATEGRVNVEKMDEDQFRSLTDAEKRRLRGD